MADIDIISRLATRFQNTTNNKRESPDPLSRDIGGEFRNNQPFISGYHYVFWTLPNEIFKNIGESASTWLHSSCEGFTPHSVTINKSDVPGLGQTGSSFPNSIVTTREFSLTFREYQNQPILTILRMWAASFDPHLGVSPLNAGKFVPSSYKGRVTVVQTKPVMGPAGGGIDPEDIEEFYTYLGVFPTSLPVDTGASSDIASNDVIQHSVSFSFDGHPISSSEVGKSEAANLFKQMKYMGTFDKYLNAAKSMYK